MSRRRAPLLAAVALAACTTQAPPTPTGLFDAAAVTADRCAQPDTSAGGTRLRVAIRRDPAVADDALRAITGEAAAVFAGAGIELVSAGVADHHGGPALAGRESEIAAILRLAGTDAGPEAEAIVLAAVVAPLRPMLATEPGADLVLVVVPRVATTDSMAARVLGEVDGIGVGPGIAGTAAGDRLLAALDAPGSFTPIAVVAAGPGAGFTAAHEIGHAFGLPHSGDPYDLMAPQRPSCVPGLAAAQAAVIAAAGER